MKTHLPAVLISMITALSFMPCALAENKCTAPPDQPGKPADTPDRTHRDPVSDPNRPGGGSDPALTPVPAPVDQTDLILKAASSGTGEMKLAQLGVTKAHDQKVKECAQMLVKDHTAANEELKALAERLKITLDAAADPQLEKTHEELNRKSGKDFDKAFLQEIASCHRKSIALFEEGKKVATAEEVKVFIEKTLPALKTHAEKIAEIGGWDTGLPVPRPKPVVDPAPETVVDRPEGSPTSGTDRN